MLSGSPPSGIFCLRPPKVPSHLASGKVLLSLPGNKDSSAGPAVLLRAASARGALGLAEVQKRGDRSAQPRVCFAATAQAGVQSRAH